MEQSISIIIPAFNEEKRIAETISSLISQMNFEEIIVVDDGSSDKTAEIASSFLGVKVIKLEKNQGKGTALNEAAKIVRGSIIVLLDADLGNSSGQVQKLIRPIIEGKGDIAIAVFPKTTQKSGFGLVKKIAVWVVSRYSNQKLREPLSGQRVFSREAFEKVTPFSEGFVVEVISAIKAGKNNLKIIEVPIKFSHRVTPRNLSGFLHRGKQLIHILQALIIRRTNI